MTVFIDKVGRLVLPKSVRRQLGITPDTPLELVRKGDGVLLRRVEARPVMQEVDGLWVHQGTPDPSADWADLIDRLRDERTDATGIAEADAGVP